MQAVTAMFEAVVEDILPVRTPAGRRRTRPGKLHADKAYEGPELLADHRCLHGTQDPTQPRPPCRSRERNDLLATCRCHGADALIAVDCLLDPDP